MDSEPDNNLKNVIYLQDIKMLPGRGTVNITL